MAGFWGYVFCCFSGSKEEEAEEVIVRKTESLQSQVAALQHENSELRKEFGDLKQQLLSTGSKHYGTLAQVPQEEHPEQIAQIMFAQFINDITIVQNTSDGVTRAELSQFAKKLTMGLDRFAQGLRQELRYELKSKLEKTAELNQKQKLAIFETLFGYTLDTNFQQCHDSALFTAYRDDLGSPERKGIEDRLKKLALEDAAKRLEFASPLLEAHDATPLLGPYTELKDCSSSTALIGDSNLATTV